jgi:hypothetical protein
MKYLTKRSLTLLEANQIKLQCKVENSAKQWTNIFYIQDVTAPYFETVGNFHNRWRERLASALSATSQMAATNFIHQMRNSVEYSYVHHVNRAQAHE